MYVCICDVMKKVGIQLAAKPDINLGGCKARCKQFRRWRSSPALLASQPSGKPATVFLSTDLFKG
jgi:hypothetical protein